jgi:hypothetical protein
MVDIPGAVGSTTAVTPGKLALGESEAGPATRKLTIRNNSSQPVTYTFGHQPALSTGGSTFTPGFFTGFASVDFSTSSVTLDPGKHANVDVTITANPTLPDRSQYGGYLVINGSDGEVNRVPYGGFTGDYQSIQALVPTAFGFPLLAREVAPGSFTVLPDGDTFTLAGNDVPQVLVHLDHQVRLLQVTVTDADTGQNWHFAVNVPFHTRSSGPTTFFAFAWDGTTMNPSGAQQFVVPDGTYTLEVSVLKALGDPGNDDHWERATLPPVTLDRP